MFLLGEGEYSSSFAFTTGIVLEVKNTLNGTPTEFALSQNYPNLFNPTTIIRYALPKAQHITLKIYNIMGQEIARLVNTQKNPGYYDVSFDASTLASGVYFYCLQSEDYVTVKKMILLK